MPKSGRQGPGFAPGLLFAVLRYRLHEQRPEPQSVSGFTCARKSINGLGWRRSKNSDACSASTTGASGRQSSRPLIRFTRSRLSQDDEDRREYFGSQAPSGPNSMRPLQTPTILAGRESFSDFFIRRSVGPAEGNTWFIMNCGLTLAGAELRSPISMFHARRIEFTASDGTKQRSAYA